MDDVEGRNDDVQARPTSPGSCRKWQPKLPRAPFVPRNASVSPRIIRHIMRYKISTLYVPILIFWRFINWLVTMWWRQHWFYKWSIQCFLNNLFKWSCKFMISFAFKSTCKAEVNPKRTVLIGELECSDLDFVHSNAWNQAKLTSNSTVSDTFEHRQHAQVVDFLQNFRKGSLTYHLEVYILFWIFERV